MWWRRRLCVNERERPRPANEAGSRVALTLDAEHPDRPASDPRSHDRIVNLLDELAVRATFFVQGRWAEAQPAAARRFVDAGHVIGNHSFYHARLPLLTDDGLREDVRESERAIVEATGVNPRPWFRCPFGAGADDRRIVSLLDELGYRNVHWTVEPKEWTPGVTWRWIEDRVVEECSRRRESIVLLHTWPDPTVEALPGIVRRLRAAGAELITVPELGSDLGLGATASSPP
jgi:peptidoglycan/xylan/chitin deacetylase (PgdA/CDA1 family)